MSTFKRSHSLVRTVILYAAVLAIVGVVFAIVQYMDRGDRPTKTPVAQDRGAPTPPPLGADRGRKKDGVKIREELPAVTAGGKSSIRIYSPDSNVARMEFKASRWQPTGPHGDELEIIEPEIRLRTPNGQEVRVTADRGLVKTKKTEGGAYDPQRGTLSGSVVVEMDRLSADERKALPPDQHGAEPPPERLVRVEFDDIEFDLEAARIATDGPFHASAVEGEVSGVGLLVRYNELNSRIEHLEIVRGKEIVLRRLGRSLQIALPGAAQTEPAVETPQEARPTETTTVHGKEEAPQPLHPDEDEIPVLLPDEPRAPSRRPIETYQVTFHGGVRIEETRVGEIIRKLVSDTLTFTVDFGRGQREAARAMPEQPADRPGPPAETQPAEPETEPVLKLTWSGRLEVDFRGVAGPEATGERLDVVAVGTPVRLRDRQGEARCGELEYHAETEQVWLRSRDDERVLVRSSDSGQMTGKEIFFDRRGGAIRVVGPGSLSDTRSRPMLFRGNEEEIARADDGFDIRFREDLAAELGTHATEIKDPLTGQPVTVRREYLKSAVLTGAVAMAQRDGSIAGERVELRFAPPDSAGSVADKIEHLFADGGVVLTHGDERIACDRLDVEMDVNERGAVSPRRAEATGNVIASQGGRRISARDRMIVDLRLYEKPKPPFDPIQVRVLAMRKGVDPQTIDWDVKRRKYEAEKRFAPGLRRLQAFGDVDVRDPAQNLKVSAEVLDCSFLAGRQIDKARITDEGESPASVELGDFSIQGRLVDLDLGQQFAHVPGAGRLTFNSRKDLDGRELDEPVRISVTWTNGMNFHGQANKALFEGSVHAASQGTTFDCRRLAIGFADVEPVEPAAKEPKKDWWILAPLFEDRDQDDATRIVAPRLKKEPAFLSATGGATALSSNVDKETGRMVSRVRLAAPAVDFDLKSKLVIIEHAGTLLIEDYRLSDRRATPSGDRTTPFGAFGGDNPSQTYLTWAGSMSYNFKFHAAHFEKSVELIHRSGAKLVLRNQLTQRAKFERGNDRKAAAGRDARLSCQSLFVQFCKRDAQTGNAATGLGALSGYDLDKFQAEKSVYFEDSGVSVNARRITYDREQTLLTIFGTPSEPAQIHDQRRGYRNITGPIIYWNRTSNRIEAPDSRIFSR